jgi:hypothetical protein
MTLRDQLQHLLVSGHDDAGFPILSSAKEDGGTRLVGYIGANELEHALSKFSSPRFHSETLVNQHGFMMQALLRMMHSRKSFSIRQFTEI